MTRVICDTSLLDLRRPTGTSAYAAAVLAALASAGVEVETSGPSGPGDVLLNLDGRFRAAPGRRSVTTVLDVGHLFERRAYGTREWLTRNWRVASAARRSDLLLLPSVAVRDVLARHQGVDPAQTEVFEALPGPEFRRRKPDEVAGLRGRLGLPDRYLVYVGGRARRKNLDLLARAWRAAATRFGPGVGLVLAGPPGPGGLPFDAPNVREVGYVAPDRLPVLLSGAVAWVNPSFYEGSALGALEAMACGAPPVVAATGASPRAVGRAGVVLEPRDERAWVDALVNLATRPEPRAGLIAAGLKLVAERRAAASGPESLVLALA